jgi:MFS transporter, DHA3 family, tetracycline resistance protein
MDARRTYYLFTALSGLGMAATATAYTPFLQDIGLSLGEVALVNAIFWTTLIAAEMPTGMLADGKSRAWSLRCGVVLYGFGALAYLFAIGFWSAVFAEMLIAVGGAFLSGAQQAWIADALTREGAKEDLRKVFATDSVIRGTIMVFGGFMGSAIALTFGYRFIWVPFLFTGAIAFYVAKRFMNGKGEPLEYVSEMQAFKLSLKLLRGSRALLWVVAALIVFGAVVSFNHYWALYFLPKVGQWNLSYFWVAIYVGFVLAGMVARKLTIPLGQESKLIAGALALTGLGLLAAASPYLGIAASGVVLHEFGRGFFVPLTDSFVQHRVHTSYRATFGSLQSFLGRIGFAIVPFIVWIGVEGKPDSPETISIVWMICAAFILLGAAVLYLIRPNGAE